MYHACAHAHVALYVAHGIRAFLAPTVVRRGRLGYVRALATLEVDQTVKARDA